MNWKACFYKRLKKNNVLSISQLFLSNTLHNCMFFFAIYKAYRGHVMTEWLVPAIIVYNFFSYLNNVETIATKWKKNLINGIFINSATANWKPSFIKIYKGLQCDCDLSIISLLELMVHTNLGIWSLWERHWQFKIIKTAWANYRCLACYQVLWFTILRLNIADSLQVHNRLSVNQTSIGLSSMALVLAVKAKYK